MPIKTILWLEEFAALVENTKKKKKKKGNWMPSMEDKQNMHKKSNSGSRPKNQGEDRLTMQSKDNNHVDAWQKWT